MVAIDTIAEFARQLVASQKHSERSQVAEEFSEWAASQLGGEMDRHLPRMVTDFAETPQGDRIMRWALMAYEGTRRHAT